MKIYVDMDGVLADFIAHFNTCFQHHYPEHTPLDFIDDLKPEVTKYPGWWDKIPPMPDAPKLMKFLKKHDFEILTAYAEWDRRSIAAKPRWMWKHFGVNPKKVHVVRRHEKQLFAKGEDGTSNILIDDYIKNIREFNSAGGIGILHTDTETTLRKIEPHL